MCLDTIRTSVLSRIKPKDAEKIKLQALAQRIIDQINAIAEKEGIYAHAKLVGSSARGTWLSGERDLDIFIMFPPEMTKEELEEKGLYIARKTASEADKYEERYAEHPYIHAVFNGFEVDLVPAFRVESAADIKSAVDRTPFHNTYVSSRIRGLEDEVLLLKQFMKGIGIYGSELKTHGFSGYLAELLIIYYGSFIKVLESGWKAGMSIDIEKHGSLKHNEPLIVVDPTDPARNVAAALSLDNFCIFIDKACDFLKSPSELYFSEHTPEPLSDDDFKSILNLRGTSLIAIAFTPPDVVEDVLFPQLHKLEGAVCEMLERHDFCVYNSGVWANLKKPQDRFTKCPKTFRKFYQMSDFQSDYPTFSQTIEKAIVVFELETASLPAVKKHAGPQVWSGEHSIAFKSKYKHFNTFSNVYIKNGRYMVEIPRKYTFAKKLVESELLKCGLGRHVALSLKKEFHVLQDSEVLKSITDGFRRFMCRFFEK